MWKVVGASVCGVSHLRDGLPCQDYCEYRRLTLSGEPVLVIAIADGAGSAAKGDLGARVAAEAMLQCVEGFHDNIHDIDEPLTRSWIQTARERIADLARTETIKLNDLAATILFAVIGENRSVFIQIGDGAWIADLGRGVEAITWPFAGEFVNETLFLTSPKALDHIMISIRADRLEAVAGFTDGIQSLALRYADRAVHAPFFAGMFAAVAGPGDEASLREPLAAFLSSQEVNDRTTDDKTLVLAVRIDEGEAG